MACALNRSSHATHERMCDVTDDQYTHIHVGRVEVMAACMAFSSSVAMLNTPDRSIFKKSFFFY